MTMNDIGPKLECGCSSPLTSPESFHIHTNAPLTGNGVPMDIPWDLTERRSFSGRSVTRIM